MLTKKHLDPLAALIADVGDATGNHYHWAMRAVAVLKLGDNPRFDAARFLEACGVETTMGDKEVE
jgi:hypothetical protein